jgi:hypothetical protein
MKTTVEQVNKTSDKKLFLSKTNNNNISWLLSFDPLDRLLKMGKKVNYKVDYKKELAEALDEKYRNIY